MRISHRTQRARVGAAAALALTAALATVGVAMAADWPQLRGDTQRSGIAAEAIKPPLAVLWRFTGGVQTNNLTSPVIVGDTVYFSTRASAQQGGILYALNVKTGQRKWSYPNDPNGMSSGAYFTTSATYAKGKLYIGSSSGTLYILDAETGKEVGGPFQLGRRIESAPVVDNDTLYFGCNDGMFYALDTQTGERRWTRMDARNRKTVGYAYAAGEGVSSAPLQAGDMMLFQTSDNQVHGLKQATGNFRWKTRLPYTFLPNGMSFSGNSIFVATGPALYSVLPASGSIRWYRNLPNDILAAPAISDGIAYVGCKDSVGDGGLLYAIKDNGREQWKTAVKIPFAPAGAPVISGDVIYVPGQRGTVMALDKSEGTLLWTYRVQPSANRQSTNPGTETAVVAPLALSGGTLFALSGDGTLTAFRADAPDSAGPIINDLYPKSGAAVNGKPPFRIAAKLSDEGSGLNPDTISGALDGRDVTLTYDFKKSTIFYATKSTGRLVDPPLADGRHEFTLRAKDWRGNETVQTWSFIVDNSLPIKPVTPTTNNNRLGGPGGPGGGSGSKGGGGLGGGSRGPGG
ncbi:PQQ-binding-like beta-propeller repeat protein [Armatimonas rosea]|uniref:Outer membrane protein assembly factor BamB n=1 Tax=Armatimonas rosea TaxID=685828 RepID=A0A7W9W5R6_ARMRO|nr:PQQ-binding-like beta-propeller repeat protein [Armatimonas rosea]MBB6048857.1 outer membrane protein assembly factor BamB [Armatimonas rosea]